MTQCELRATSPKPGRRTPDKIDKSRSKASPQLRPRNLFSRDTAFTQQRDEGFSEVLATIKQIGLFMLQPPQESQLPVAGVVRHSTKSKVGFDFSNRHFIRCNLLKEAIPVFLQHKAHVVGPTRSRFSPTVNITEETLERRFYVWLTPWQNSEVGLTRAPSDKSWRKRVGIHGLPYLSKIREPHVLVQQTPTPTLRKAASLHAKNRVHQRCPDKWLLLPSILLVRTPVKRTGLACA